MVTLRKMKPFSRGALLVAIVDLILSILGLAFGAKLYLFSRTVHKFNLSFYNALKGSRKTNNSPRNFNEFDDYSSFRSPLSPYQSNDPSDIYFTIVHSLLLLYFTIYLCIFVFAIVLILGVKQESPFKIKMWLYPNLAFIILLTFLSLSMIFVDFAWSARIYIFWLVISGSLIFRAFECWIVYETQLEISRDQYGQVHQSQGMPTVCVQKEIMEFAMPVRHARSPCRQERHSSSTDY